MSAVPSGYLEGDPTWCLICNDLFMGSVQDHAGTSEHQSNYTDDEHRWDTVRVDTDPDDIRSMVERRNVYQHSDEEILAAMADHPDTPL